MRVQHNVLFKINGGAAYGIRHFNRDCFYCTCDYETFACYFRDWWGDKNASNLLTTIQVNYGNNIIKKGIKNKCNINYG